MTDTDDFWGPVIHTVTREDLIEDGTLVDLTANFPHDTRVYKYPVACTRTVWALVEEAVEKIPGNSLGGIVWDLCYMSARTGRHVDGDPTTVTFKVIIGKTTHTLKAVCGPANPEGDPCVTIMMLDED